MSTKSRLAHALGIAYGARVLGKPGNPHATFVSHAAADDSFIKAAQAEHARLVGMEHGLGCPLSQRCFVSAHNLKFLGEALARHATTQQQDRTEMPSKLKALAGIAKSHVSDVEKAAETALDELGRAKARAMTGVDKVHTIAAEIDQSADDLNDFANQTSNFPPSDEK